MEETVHEEQAPAAKESAAQPVAQAPTQTPASTTVVAPVQPAASQQLALTPEVRAALEKSVQNWNKAFADRSSSITALYDTARYNREPGVPRGFSYNSTVRELERRFKAPWLRLISRKPRFEILGNLAVSHCEQLVVSPSGLEQGVLSLWWNRDDKGGFHIVGSQFKAEELGLAADYLDQISADASNMVEKWRKAWESGNLESYISYYADDAIQSGRWGAKNIQRQKEILWQRAKPTLVQISGLRLVAEKQGVRADMTQVYTDSSGHTDRGTKTLLLRYDGQNWRIAREDWAPLPAAAQQEQGAE